MPDIVDLYRDFSVDVTPLASFSVFGIDVTFDPDFSVASSISVDPGASYADADPGDRCGSIRNPSHK